MIKTEAYPVFMPNQVLSDGQMNKILNYLEPQDRATRKLAIGQGILNGFLLVSTTDSITIGPGVGLTSAGFLISISKEIEFKHGVAFSPVDQYPPFTTTHGIAHIELLELRQQATPDNPTSTPLSSLNLDDYVVAIFLDQHEFDLTTCLPENCDSQGAEMRLEWRLLLLKRADALEVLRNGDDRLAAATDEAEITRILQAKYELKKMTLRRPLLGPDNVVKYSTLTRSYNDICREELSRFKDALITAYHCYGLVVETVNINQVVEQLFAHFRQLGDGRGLQYFWYYLDELFHAYNEFIEKAFMLTAMSRVSEELFSHHLFLGPGKKIPGCRPTIFRHSFTPAREHYFYGDFYGEVTTLFQRILLLIKGFKWKPGTGKLRITPQKLGSGFEERAIGHYLNRQLVGEAWSLAANQRCQQDLIPSYDRKDDRILQENLHDYNHLQIGDHMYRKKEEVLKELEKLRVEHNLPFAVKCLELGAVPQFSSGGCNIGSLRILYEIARLDVLCFVEDKSRFFNSIVADDLEFELPEDEIKERELERKPTRIEASKKLDFAEVIDFGRNRVFTTQKRKAQQKEVSPVVVDFSDAPVAAGEIPPGETAVDPIKAVSKSSIIYKPVYTTDKYTGRKQSRYEKDFDEAELEKIEVPLGVREIVGRKTATPRIIKEERFEERLAPKADVTKKEIPVEEDSTSFTIKARDIAFVFPKTPVTDYINYPKDELGDRLLSELVGNLVKLLEELPEEVHLFDPEAIEKIYAVIKDKALALKDIVEQLLGSEDYVPKGVEYALIAELLELVDACLDKRLGKIAELHKSEWQAAENAGVLADYIKKHPSIHYCGGVHVGGTHVLVSGYIDKVREISRIKELTRPLFVKAPLAVYKELRGNVYENVLRTAGHFNRKAFTWSKGIDLQRIKDSTRVKEDPAPVITLDRTRSALLDGLLRTIESSSDEELVLFNFCHQYICCSDCSSIEYVVIAELKIYLPKLMFCIDDTENYAFGVYPPGGQVQGSGVKKIGETYYFIPSDSSIGEQLFKYVFGGREVQLVAKVAARPQARFTYMVEKFVSGEEGLATAVIVRFTNLSTNADEYHWQFGDDITSVDDSPVHTYDLTDQNSFKVTLTAITDACRDETTQELSLVPIEFYIEKHLAEFCNADPAGFKLIAEPVEGGVFGKNDAISVETRTFHPNKVNLGGASRKTELLTYQLDQQQATLSVNVYAQPQPSFKTEILQSGDQSIIVRFINGTINGSEYTWNFGDGATSNRPDPTHEYKLAGEANFTVVLTAVNGPCVESFQDSLTLTPLLLQYGVESDGKFCETDKEGVALVGTPAGGVLSGAGIKDGRFIPANVAMGTLSKKTVTLQYTTGVRSTTLQAEVYKHPVLRFTHLIKPAALGVSVSFTNQSIHAERYVWDFGDGSGEFAGYNISHFYKRQGVYKVSLRGINPPCDELLTQTIAARIDEPLPPEIVPMRPLKAEIGLLGQSKVSDFLRELKVNSASLNSFYRQMAEIVGTGSEDKIRAFAMDDFWFLSPTNEIMTLGKSMFEVGRGLQEAQLGILIDIYRLSLCNIINMLSKRNGDLGRVTELNQQLRQIIKLTGELNPHLGFEKFQTDGFELVPTSTMNNLPNLQGIHGALGKIL